MASWADNPKTAEAPARPQFYSFAVYPADFGDAFEPFLLDVPAYAQGPAARRAYFTAMAKLAGEGIDVEDFAVCVWADGRPGPLVGPGGVQS